MSFLSGNPAVMTAVVAEEVEDTNNSNSNDDTGVPELLVQADMGKEKQPQEYPGILIIRIRDVIFFYTVLQEN